MVVANDITLTYKIDQGITLMVAKYTLPEVYWVFAIFHGSCKGQFKVSISLANVCEPQTHCCVHRQKCISLSCLIYDVNFNNIQHTISSHFPLTPNCIYLILFQGVFRLWSQQVSMITVKFSTYYPHGDIPLTRTCVTSLKLHCLVCLDRTWSKNPPKGSVTHIE